jgi:hypothetical protein
VSHFHASTFVPCVLCFLISSAERVNKTTQEIRGGKEEEVYDCVQNKKALFWFDFNPHHDTTTGVALYKAIQISQHIHRIQHRS